MKNILITGVPKTGKSTLLAGILQEIPSKRGFLTKEIVQKGERVGFSVELHSGKSILLAHKKHATEHVVGSYRVDVESFEQSIIRELEKQMPFHPAVTVYMDEIGQMQLLSKRFCNWALKILGSHNLCIATVSKVYSNSFIQNLKRREDSVILELTGDNYDEVRRDILTLIAQAQAA